MLFVGLASGLADVEGQETNSMILGIITMTPIAILDLMFTVKITADFLSPIFDVLRMGKGSVKSASMEKLERTKWRTFVGGKSPSDFILFLHCAQSNQPRHVSV